MNDNPPDFPFRRAPSLNPRAADDGAGRRPEVPGGPRLTFADKVTIVATVVVAIAAVGAIFALVGAVVLRGGAP
jgi:hypothetical protein